MGPAPILILAGVIIAFASLMSTGNARAEKARELGPGPGGGGDGHEGCNEELLLQTILAISTNTATRAMVQGALLEARKCGKAESAAEFQRWLDDEIPRLLKAADRPAEPIPADPTTGIPLWKMMVKGGELMAVPMFASILEQFKALQGAIGARADGRIGPDTLAAFVKRAKQGGYRSFPDTQGKIAANVVKWTEVFKRNADAAMVGFESPIDGVSDSAWSEFIEKANGDWDALIPRVQEKLGSYLNSHVSVNDTEYDVTMSGLLGLVTRAGMSGAKQWLTNEGDRVKYPATTVAFLSTNGLF